MADAHRNTDGRFWAYQSVATLPDTTGMFRASIVRLSDLYDWTESALAEVIERAANKARLLPPLSREEYDALGAREARIGYCETPDASAPIIFRPWVNLLTGEEMA